MNRIEKFRGRGFRRPRWRRRRRFWRRPRWRSYWYNWNYPLWNNYWWNPYPITTTKVIEKNSKFNHLFLFGGIFVMLFVIMMILFLK